MGWFDWLVSAFRGARPEASPITEAVGGDVSLGASASAASSGASASRGARPPSGAARPTKKSREKAKKVQAVPVGTEGAGREGSAVGKRKSRADGGLRPKAPAASGGASAPPPGVEVLSAAEAERRYGELVRGGAGVAGGAPVAPPPVAPPPVMPASAADRSVADARRAAAAAQRLRADLAGFGVALSRADALLAVAQADPRHLRAARRALVEAADGLPLEGAALAAYQRSVAAFDERLQAVQAAEDADRAAVQARRQAIADAATALVERDDLRGAGPELGELRSALRALGLMESDNPALLGFAAAEVRFRDRLQQRKDAADATRAAALERRAHLLRRAEALVQLADREVAAERIKSLQAEWKAVRVPGPRVEPDTAWTQFRAACDAVFAARATAREAAVQTTLERLEAIVVRVESAEDGDPDELIARATDDWRRIGRAPPSARDAQQVLWDRLQRAFDRLRAPSPALAGQDTSALRFNPFSALSGE
jgi:hypothetical protein